MNWWNWWKRVGRRFIHFIQQQAAPINHFINFSSLSWFRYWFGLLLHFVHSTHNLLSLLVWCWLVSSCAEQWRVAPPITPHNSSTTKPTNTPRNHKNNQFVHSFSNWMILLVCSTARRSSLFLAGCLRLAAALNPPKKKDNWRALSFSARNETIHSSKTNFHFVFSSFIHSFSWAAEGRSKWKQTILPILKRRIDLFSCCWWPAAYLCFINSLQSSINQVLVWFRLTSVSSASIYLLL